MDKHESPKQTAGDNPYRAFDRFILRTPLYPLEHLEKICAMKPWQEETVREICDRSDIREAIMLASPDLYAEMNRYLSGKLDNPKLLQRFFFSLYRYTVRLSMRCTPFGLFAAFSCGNWSDGNDIRLVPRSQYNRHTRLDMHYLCALALDLAKKSELAKYLSYFPNSSLHRVGKQYRYVEYRYNNKRRTHHIVAVGHDEYLEKVLAESENGTGLDRLADLLIDHEITLDEARSYIQELIDNQVLVHSLEPTLTGPEFIEQILAVIAPVETVRENYRILTDIRDRLLAIDRMAIGDSEHQYSSLSDEISSLGTPYETKFLYQTDMVKPTQSCRLDKTLVDDLLAGITVLNRLTPQPAETLMNRFKIAFLDRYEQRSVPLLEVLDTEMGIGYPASEDSRGDLAPLVDDLMINGSTRSDGQMPWNKVDSFLFGKYRQALTEGLDEIVLSDEDLKDFPLRWDDLPDTLSMMVHVFQEDRQERPTLVATGVGGNAGNLLGRFCHADQATHELVQEIMDRETQLQPDAIYAEISHLPEARLGNILLRPVLREYEIPYLGRSAVAADHQIRLKDLVVSIRDNRVVLSSRRHGKEIRPRLTSAHNYTNNALPIYHFLCDLQSQNLRGGLFFSWGSLAGEMPFLPRVRYRNLILHPAAWQIKKKDIEPIVRQLDYDEALLRECKIWRERIKIPLAACLADGDNELYVRFDNLLSIRNLLSQVKERSVFKLVEFPFTPQNSPVSSQEGHFANEVIACFHRQQAKDTTKHHE